jgi:hypothetical protein
MDTSYATKFLIAVVIAPLLGMSTPSEPAKIPAQEIVNEVIFNELKADNDDHSQWMYLSRNVKHGTTETRKVIEAKQCDISELILVNGKPLSPERAQREQHRIAKLVNDPDELAKEHKKNADDDEKAHELMKVIHDAFLFDYDGQAGTNIKIAFRPNPSFNPPTREARVMHSMAGLMVVDAKEKRLRSLAGHMVNDVDFGGGLLGRLKKGGRFTLRRARIAPGIWRTTLIDVHLNGRALLFKTIHEEQHEVRSCFRRIQEELTAQQAARILTQKRTLPTTARGHQRFWGTDLGEDFCAPMQQRRNHEGIATRTTDRQSVTE